ncbi:hypothetical protein H5410_039899 [Solanum commersonii]|uniref:CCHC-type domain-containing protein n=1 Tax=Solanum commersonii TaxID=4109 RepID=A0A9J5XMB1_SOLCO|nr:hypothetical protein H5410_039899 [Solanum commersonii]
MELPECNNTHWKSKFIDRLPTLFAERVRKSLRGDDHSINYDNYTYGKLISACVQEGLSLCNEIKLNQQIKRHRLTERKQLGEFCEQFAFDIPKQKSKDMEDSHKKKKSSKKDYEKWKKKKIEKKLRRAEEGRGDSSKRKKKYWQSFNKSDTCHKCGRYGHYAKDCRVKEKIKNLDIDDNLKDSLHKIMLNSDSESGSAYSSREYSSTSEDLKALQQEEYLTSKMNARHIYEQFKELSLNVIDNDKVIELLQNIKDPEIRTQIIDKISDSMEKEHITEKDYIPKEIPTKEGSYTMAEVKNLLLERRKMTSSPTTISDLKEEINNLKEDITRLKEKNVIIENLNDKASESSSSMEEENDSLDFIKNIYLKNDKTDFLYSLKAFTSQKMINDLTAKLLVSKNNQVSFIKQEINNIEVNHILQNPKLQEKIAILRNQFSIDICGDHPNAFWNRKKHSIASSSSSGMNIDHPMYKEFMDFMKSTEKLDNNPPSYSSILIDDENIEVFDLNDKKEVILLLEESDLKWRNESWQIMARYLDTVSYTATVYKYRMHYEMILSSTGCEFQHFYPANTKKVYNFSKLIIKRIIASEEWGMSTLKELDYIHSDQKVAVKYNYWDYMEGFNKVLLYENVNRKHSWFIKKCSNIFDRYVPNWFCKWWTLYGPSIKILPESYKKLYLEWVDISPKIIKMQEENIFFEGISVMYFFMEFSIPWIMKWSIEVHNTLEGFSCLQRTKNPEGKLHGQEIIDLINVTISKYYNTAHTGPQAMEDSSPFKRITRKLQMKKGLISKSEAIAIYMEEVKKDLMKNLDFEIKDDISMISASHTNEEEDACIAGEGQDVDDEEEDLETILKRY